VEGERVGKQEERLLRGSRAARRPAGQRALAAARAAQQRGR
jgi:hypothetical protein